ncbi:MAG: hypothetical protein U5R14_00710 [Gemmatimonadota bacterium]|nr:hypothetical protein [Gemmatimonadota bacterium]
MRLGLADLLEQPESFFDAEPRLVAVLRDGRTVDVLHHEVWLTVWGGAAVEQAPDVGVEQGRQDLPVGTEPCQKIFGVQPLPDDFHGHLLTPSTVRALAEIDRRHAAPGDAPDQPVGAELVSAPVQLPRGRAAGHCGGARVVVPVRYIPSPLKNRSRKST